MHFHPLREIRIKYNVWLRIFWSTPLRRLGIRTARFDFLQESLIAMQTYLSRSRLEEKPEPGRFVFLEVTDTGCGMDAETQRRLFDPFFSTKFWGRGLGMAKVMGITKGHHGAIIVDSEVGKGTTIRVLFPVSKEAQAPLFRSWM